jgi:hypothetical protein
MSAYTPPVPSEHKAALQAKAIAALERCHIEGGWPKKAMARHLFVAYQTMNRWMSGANRPDPRNARNILAWAEQVGTFTKRPPARR